jgi:sarcosine oxidase, subunit beta
MWRSHDLQDSYDVVIIGGGAHGLACAYYLARDHGITNVAVIERQYIGAGGSGRNTTIIRSNYLTPEGVHFYDESVKLYEQMAAELDFNVMFSQRGHLTLAHTDAAVRTMRRRAEVNRLQGVDSRLIWPDEIKRLCPPLDVSDHPRYPILAALYHPPGGIIRHDAVVWAYARHADQRGVHIHQKTAVTGIRVQAGRVVGVETSAGFIKTAPCSTSPRAGAPPSPTWWASAAHHHLPPASLRHRGAQALPGCDHRLRQPARLRQPVGPGELVMGAAVDPFASYSMRGSLAFTEGIAGHMLELFPGLGKVRMLRQWAACAT